MKSRIWRWRIRIMSDRRSYWSAVFYDDALIKENMDMWK